jgi:hypothetical protein
MPYPGAGESVCIQSENVAEVTRSERRQYTTWFEGGSLPIFTTHPKAEYPGGGTGIQIEHSFSTVD